MHRQAPEDPIGGFIPLKRHRVYLECFDQDIDIRGSSCGTFWIAPSNPHADRTLTERPARETPAPTSAGSQGRGHHVTLSAGHLDIFRIALRLSVSSLLLAVTS